MAFTPIEGYSEKRTSTVFQDGETKQRAEFNYNLSNTDWTPISYDENRTTVLVQNGDIKQRATVVYNIGESSGGGTVSGLTSVSHGSTLTGNGTTTSPLDVSSTITGDINTLKTAVSGKQDALTETQLEAVNSGITAEHVASYDAYAGEITAVETTANKADSAAEVAQQTANLVGQNLQAVTAKIPTTASASNQLVDANAMNTALATKANTTDVYTKSDVDSKLGGKVNIAQGADNAGRVLSIDNSGNVVPITIPTEQAVAVLLYYDSTQASDHSHAYSDVSLTGYDLAGYEVYSNGYVRQWGQDSTAAAGATLVTLPISYNAASTVSMSFFVSVTEVAAEATGSISAIPVAANQFQVDKPSTVCNWETTGYITL